MGLFASTLLLAAALQAQNATEAGRFHVEHPTLLNLGFEWAITGDANRNATVSRAVSRRRRNGMAPALPLVRIGGENIFRRRENLDYTVPDGFAGSILNLHRAPSTNASFRLDRSRRRHGPDRRTPSRFKTRTEPQPSKEGRTLHVYPPDYEGKRIEPSFTEHSAGLLRRGTRRLERRLGAPRATGRHAPRPCRPLQTGAVQLRRPDDDAVRRLDVANPQRHARQAHHDQGRRRRRSHLRRRRQFAGSSMSWPRSITSSMG